LLKNFIQAGLVRDGMTPEKASSFVDKHVSIHTRNNALIEKYKHPFQHLQNEKRPEADKQKIGMSLLKVAAIDNQLEQVLKENPKLSTDSELHFYDDTTGNTEMFKSAVKGKKGVFPTLEKFKNAHAHQVDPAPNNHAHMSDAINRTSSVAVAAKETARQPLPQATETPKITRKPGGILDQNAVKSALQQAKKQSSPGPQHDPPPTHKK